MKEFIEMKGLSTLFLITGTLFLALCLTEYLVHKAGPNVGGYKEQFENSDKNILGNPMSPCSNFPGKITGFYRDGYCSTGPTDTGKHVVCAVVDDEFLQFTKGQGNDLITPNLPSFPGLVQGDRWCLCALRWMEAYRAGKAPKILAESTNEKALQYVPKDVLRGHSSL